MERGRAREGGGWGVSGGGLYRQKGGHTPTKLGAKGVSYRRGRGLFLTSFLYFLVSQVYLNFRRPLLCVNCSCTHET